MTTTTATPFVIERIDLRDPDGNLRPEQWELESVEEAAAKFESEVEGWPYDEILEELASGSRLTFVDHDQTFEVTARRGAVS